MEAVIQTWDGILHSERLLTMSCSDKLARWNVTGIQGSLLTHIINPIYLSTIIVGDCYHRVHLKRALIGRIEHLQVNRCRLLKICNFQLSFIVIGSALAVRFISSCVNEN